MQKPPTGYLNIVVDNPSKKRGHYVNYAYKIYSSTKGKPIFLINGWTQCKENWTDNFIHSLSKDRMVIVSDHRGIGQSKIISNSNNNNSIIPSFTLIDLANDICQLISYLKIKKIDICGHSMGGMIAQQFALNYPHYISNLILMSTSPAGGRNVPFIKPITKKWFKDSAKIALLTDKNKIFNAAIESMLFSLGPLYDKNNQQNMQKIKNYIAQSMKLNKPPSTGMTQLKAIGKWNGIQHLKTLDKYSNYFKFPIILIHGDQDNVCDARNALFINQQLTNSKLYLLDGIGHVITLDGNGCNKLIEILSKLTNYDNKPSKL